MVWGISMYLEVGPRYRSLVSLTLGSYNQGESSGTIVMVQALLTYGEKKICKREKMIKRTSINDVRFFRVIFDPPPP